MRDDPRYLWIVVSGTLELDRSRRFIQFVRDKAKEQGQRRVLIDARAFTNPMPNADRFAVGELVAEEWRGLRVAVISPVEALNGFIETVAVNRGADARGFSHEHEATDWLLQARFVAELPPAQP